MINRKEITAILVSTLVLAFLVTLAKEFEMFLGILLAVFLVLFINVASKKIMAFYLESEIEIKFWEMQRFGWPKHHHFKKPFPAGLIIPFITTVFSIGYFTWLASLAFEVKPKIYRAAKRHGLYSFSEMTEIHIAMIAAAGIIGNLAFAILGYFLGFENFVLLNIYFAFFNMVPFSELDGNKIFMGSITLWSFLVALVLVGIGYAFLIV